MHFSSSSLQSSALESICDGLKSLESLSTSRCYGIPPPTFLILKTSSVRYLNLFGSLKEAALAELKKFLPNVEINKFLFSSIARPTVGIKRTSIWILRVRDQSTYSVLPQSGACSRGIFFKNEFLKTNYFSVEGVFRANAKLYNLSLTFILCCNLQYFFL